MWFPHIKKTHIFCLSHNLTWEWYIMCVKKMVSMKHYPFVKYICTSYMMRDKTKKKKMLQIICYYLFIKKDQHGFYKFDNITHLQKEKKSCLTCTFVYLRDKIDLVYDKNRMFTINFHQFVSYQIWRVINYRMNMKPNKL
jgi:hypothetical protein